jgi:hypothetical protein
MSHPLKCQSEEVGITLYRSFFQYKTLMKKLTLILNA